MRVRVEAHCREVALQPVPEEQTSMPGDRSALSRDRSMTFSAITVSEEEEEEEFHDAQQDMLLDPSSTTGSTSSVVAHKKRVSFASVERSISERSIHGAGVSERSIYTSERSTVTTERSLPSLTLSPPRQKKAELVPRGFWSKGRYLIFGVWRWIHWVWSLIRERRAMSNGLVTLIALSLLWKRFTPGVANSKQLQ